MMVFKVKFRDGSYLGLDNNKNLIKTTRKEAKYYLTRANAESAAKIARYKQFLWKEAFWAQIVDEHIG